MDKEIMDLTSSSSPPQNSNNDHTNLINHPQNEDIHNQGSGFTAGNNGINNKEEIVPCYDFQPIRHVSASLDAPAINNNPKSWSLIDSKIKYGSLDSLEPVKDIQEKDQKAVDTSLVAAIDQTLKKHTDNLMHMLEGVGARLTQLESRTSNLETSVDDLKLSIGNNHESTDGKMRLLENILKEVQAEVHIVKENQGSLEALVQLPKPQLSKRDLPSETHSTPHMDSLQQAASAPFQSHQQLPPAAAFPQSLLSTPPPPPPTVPQAVPQRNLPPTVQHPDQFPPHQIPSVPQRDAYYPPPGQPQETSRQQFPMPPTHQVPSVPQRDAYYPPAQTQETPSQQFPMPPAQQPQHSPAALPNQPYQPAPPPHYSQPPQPLQVQPTIGHHPEEASYVPSQTYPQNVHQPPSQPPSGPPSSQQYFGIPSQMHEPPSRRPGPGFSTGYIPQSGASEPYGYGGSSPQYRSSPMKMPQLPSSTGSGYPQFSTARVLPHALPTASGVGGGPTPSGPGNRVPIDDIVDKVTSMGFPRDLARETVRKLTENGQAVDLNAVLDKLMNDGDLQPPRGWSGR
ncbi:COPII coat assembly protein sec16-like isoform X2 [Hibiscus syriacus]|uniref:COPII coat assembly protein sec16-like isoform X2 n=1 Tax=Hibiscus syriacus TaxID=106335 RepID=UPI001924395F|nr:COPII coat assembly protein sec16-like isoform X2 [Hibiscus syriacus]